MIQAAIKFSIWRSAEIVSAEVEGEMSISVVPKWFCFRTQILQCYNELHRPNNIHKYLHDIISQIDNFVNVAKVLISKLGQTDKYEAFQ